MDVDAVRLLENTALAGSTGGRYYGADNGEELSRAVMMAAVQRMPYEIVDGSGRTVASGVTSELARDLPSGTYRVRVSALEQKLETSATVNGRPVDDRGRRG